MSRVWIYQASRELTPAELEHAKTSLNEFTGRWAAHNNKLTASYDIRYGRFVILMVDEADVEASGCSIDESVRQIKDLEKTFGVSFFDRRQMAFLQGDQVQSCDLNEIGALYREGRIADDTLVFNNIVQSLPELESQWQIPFSKSGYATFAG